MSSSCSTNMQLLKQNHSQAAIKNEEGVEISDRSSLLFFEELYASYT